MRIDSTHRPWIFATLALSAIAGIAYIAYWLSASHGPDGGSALGLTYGIAGTAVMLFAGLLGLRKRFAVMRLGRAQTWMRGHLWLGLLSLPLILFHSGFSLGGALSSWLAVLYFLVIASGIFGAVLQHYLPGRMTEQLPMETIYEEIRHVREQLLEEADALVAPLIGAVGEPGAAAEKVAPAEKMSAGEAGEAAAAQPAEAIPEESVARLRTFYVRELRPYLEKPAKRGQDFAEARHTTAVFRQLRVFLPPSLYPMLEDLADICEEEQQLTKQARLHRLLHGWLLVHIPLSYAVLVLTAAHAWMALKY